MMENTHKRFVGLDLAKRTVEVCILSPDNPSRRMSGIKTDEKGRARLAALLDKDDAVGMEACSRNLPRRWSGIL
jgi:hypothetical protein